MSAPGLVVLVGAPALLGVLAFFAFHWWRTRKVGTLAFHRRTFMTPNEVEFYHRLRKACGEDYVVMAQVSMAKCYAADVAMRVTTEAVQVLGGYGYVRDYHVERMMRDAKVFQILDGSNEVQRIVLGRHVLREAGAGSKRA